MESVATFVECLKQLHILPSAQLAEVQSLEPRYPDPRALAKELVQRGWVTPYQINRLLQGRGKDLVMGSYVVLELLGQGGMGQVLKARHLRLDRIDALKVIRKEYLDRPNALERFQREAKAAARLSHPNVITVYDAGDVGGIHFLSMEYVEGTDLARLVKQAGPLPITQACEYIRQAAQGLQHVHQRGLIHRDIKPSNLLVTKDQGVVKLLDLGLARLGPLGAGETAHSLTETGTVVGTADFIAPEQARDARDVDIRADIYSLGCTLYFLLTGKIPFPAETLTAKLLMHQLEEPEPLRSLRPEVSAGLDAVVQRMMAKKLTERYQTPAEVAAALTPFAGGADAMPLAVPVLDHSHALLSDPHFQTRDGGFGGDTINTRQRQRAPKRRLWVMLLAGGSALFAVMACGVMGLVLGFGRGSVPTTTKVAVAPTRPDTAATKPDTKAQGNADDQNLRAHLERAEALHAQRRYDQAIVEYTAALTLQPDNAATYSNRGEAYRNKGEHDKAIADYTKAVELNPKLVNGYFGRASAYYAKGDLDRCLADNTTCIKLRDNHPATFNNRGTVYYQKKMYEQAILDFNQAIRLNDRYAGAYHNRGNCYRDTGQFGLALADFDKAIAIDPTSPSSFNCRGEVHYARGDFDRALDDYNRAIELARTYALAYFNRSKTHAKKGNAVQADADMRQAVKLDPTLKNAP